MTDMRPTTSGQMTIYLPDVIKTLGERLYSDPSVSVRELLQNANDSCVVRQAEDPEAPPAAINVSFDPWKAKLVVEDNGAGLTEEEVKEFLAVIGKSKTTQVRERLEAMGRHSLAERLIGQFGLGLLSAFVIGDRIEFVTLSHKEGAEAIWWACDGGQEYRMGPSTDRTTPGTTVTLEVNPKHVGMLRDEKLAALIHLYADLLEVPIYLNLGPNPVNVITAPWNREATEAEYRQFATERYPDDAILDIIPVEISEDDGKFKVGGVLLVPKQPLFIVNEHGDLIVYVRRMYVCSGERSLLPEWAKFVKGIIESPNLHETTGREAVLRDEAFKRVQKALGDVILGYLSRVAAENPRLFKEIVTNHNLVIKAWAIVSDVLFDHIKDIVLFNTDAGLLNLQSYFETSRYSKLAANAEPGRRYIFYFTSPGGAGTTTVLFAAKGIRVIDAQHFPDESFLRKYADRHDDVVLKRLEVGGDLLFEELEHHERRWAELEEEYANLRIDAKVARFAPDDVSAVLVFPETEPVTDIDTLLGDPNLSPTLKNLVRQMWEERQKQRKGRVSGGGLLYVNANNPVMQKLADLDLTDYEMQDVMLAIYHNALVLSTQGARMALTPDNAKKVFESNNRTIASLMSKIYEVRDLKVRQLVLPKDSTSVAVAAMEPEALAVPSMADAPQTSHITCFVALPFAAEYEVVFEALRDVLEVRPYFWQVVRGDKRFLANDVPDNVFAWMRRAHCYAADISEANENVMMEAGFMYWAFPNRPLLVLQREGTERRLPDLGGRLRITYPSDGEDLQRQITDALRAEIAKFDKVKLLQAQAHWLSARVLNELDYVSGTLASRLADEYETIESLVAADPQLVAQRIGPRIAPPGVVQAIQEYLTEICGLH
jgi:molecular chaperone HtpG